MAGEHDDYKHAESELRREQWARHSPWLGVPRPPLWKRVLRILYWLSSPALAVIVVVHSFVVYGWEAGLLSFGVLFLLFGLPIIIALVKYFREG